jgi:small subunit ribosomal protein S1
MADKNAQTGNADFDWSSIGKKNDTYSESERTSLDEMYGKSLSTISDAQVITGTVVSKNAREVVVNIGYKSDGVVSLSEFRYNPDLKIGDSIEVFIEKAEDANGQLILSHKLARAGKSWDRVNEALTSDEIIKGFVKCRTKGGLIVDVFGVEAFLPGSQIDVKPIRDYDVYVGKTMEFKVVKINNEFKNVVVSHKALIEAEIESQKRDIISKLEKGQVLEGIVKNITTYGVFIDLGGVDGLIHITDLSWGRINHPEEREMSWSQHLRSAQEFLKVGQDVDAVVLTLDREERKMSLGVKQLTPDPWNMIIDKYAKGTKHNGIVRNFTNFGVFVELEEGVDGLVHISDLSWSKKIKHPSEFCKIGDKLDVTVLEIDGENRRLSLGHKQLEDNPWDVFETVFTIDSVHQGTITSINDKGATINLTYGVEGFCPSRHLNKADGTTAKVEDVMDFKVIEFSKESKRIVVSHARLHEEVKEEAKKVEKATKSAESDDTKKAVKKMKDNQEKTTLGDISALSDLKNKMDGK